MTLASNKSKNKDLLLFHNIPQELQVKLSEVSQQPYAELYEAATEESASLQDALEEILLLFQLRGSPILGHIRYVWMALILTLVVEPTIECYQPNNSIPDKTIEQMTFWLLKAITKAISSETPFIKNIELAQPAPDFYISSFAKEKLANFQVIYEAIDVYNNAIKTLDNDQSLDALLDILDDCLEGYAIFPGSYGKRELLNWWLLDVVPASWYLLPPNSIYVVDGLPTSANIGLRQMKRLDKISSFVWSIILNAHKNREGLKLKNLLGSYKSSQNEIKLDIKTHDDFSLNSIKSNDKYSAKQLITSSKN